MKRATELQMTTAGDVVRLLSSGKEDNGASAAVDKLSGLHDALEVAFIVASVMHGLKNPYAADLVNELRERVNTGGVEQEATMNDQDRYIDDAHLISTAIDLQDCLVIGCLLDYGHPGLHVYDALGHAGHCMEREVGK